MKRGNTVKTDDGSIGLQFARLFRTIPTRALRGGMSRQTLRATLTGRASQGCVPKSVVSSSISTCADPGKALSEHARTIGDFVALNGNGNEGSQSRRTWASCEIQSG